MHFHLSQYRNTVETGTLSRTYAMGSISNTSIKCTVTTHSERFVVQGISQRITTNEVLSKMQRHQKPLFSCVVAEGQSAKERHTRRERKARPALGYQPKLLFPVCLTKKSSTTPKGLAGTRNSHAKTSCNSVRGVEDTTASSARSQASRLSHL